ncbi:MAG: DUF4062 domain-containing protein [Clostridia bacterium]|nr:DUF4062 domain-containing protein [Clostridia bacterium]
MIFSPKIFISSTFSDNKELRDNIDKYFQQIGATPLLYEYNLTPSTKPLTYRTDILEADFIILIIKDKYGTKTKSGFSGIHEEYKIASANGIPMHIYLKKNPKESKKKNKLVDEVKSEGISYYYFENDEEVLNQIKKTTFVIAKEIMLNQITKNNLPRNTIINLASNEDYNKAMEIISIIEDMRKLVVSNELDWIYTDIFTVCVEPIMYEFPALQHKFINWKIDELLQEMLIVAREFIKHSTLDFSTVGNFREYKISILAKIEVSNLSNANNSNIWGISNYENCLKRFFGKYEEFKKITQDIRIEADIIK